MIRRFNYTERKKIVKSRVDISLHKDREGRYFRSKVDLEGLKFPPEAKVYIEAYFKGVYQRFECGVVSNPREPADTRLTELPETELIYFDVSVVDESGKLGLLLGKARGVAVSTTDKPNDRIPLLPVNPVDLKNQIWKLGFDSGDDGRPVLEVNRNIPDILERARSDADFISLVYPVVFRSVLSEIVDSGDFGTDGDSWVSDWMKFISFVLGIKYTPETDNEIGELNSAKDEWIDDCVNEYCRKFQIYEKFTIR